MPDRDPTAALIVVDVQNDFCPGGALGVAGGDQLAGRLAEAAETVGTVVATRDWHPPDHVSFVQRGGTWPVHCVAGTPGAELHPSVAGMTFDRVQDKGSDGEREAYSGFDGTELAAWLRERGVERVKVGGIATDYCVRATALDALENGFETTVLADATAAVELAPGDGERALAEVRAAGAAVDRVHLLRDADDLRALLERRVQRVREIVDGTGRDRLVLGLSGGIDSALALALAARALGPERVTAVRLPSRHTEEVHLRDAEASARAAGLPTENLLTVSIEPIVEGVVAARGSIAGSAMRFGNASARARMIVLFDIAAELGGLVCGTENRSEFLLGYFTRFGDAASDLEPIHDLFKAEVRLASRLLEQPEAVITKEPTAGLWGGQTDEEELGFSYHEADLAMACMADLGMTPERAAERSGVDLAVVRAVKARMDAVAWKAQVPYHA